MKIPAYATAAYALLLILGGLIGFFVAGSEVSLWMGASLGLILLIAAYTTYCGRPVGLYTTVVVSIALSFFFGYRYALTDKIMPGGLMMFFSLIMLGISFVTLKLNEK